MIYPQCTLWFDPDGLEGATGTPLDNALNGDTNGNVFTRVGNPGAKSQKSVARPSRWPFWKIWFSNAEHRTKVEIATASGVGAADDSHCYIETGALARDAENIDYLREH